MLAAECRFRQFVPAESIDIVRNLYRTPLPAVSTHMPLRCSLKGAVTALTLLVLFSSTAGAQIRGRLFVSGLTQPVAFVQDPDNAAVQFVVEKAGLIRVIQSGALQATPFLDLRGAVATDNERGLVSLALHHRHNPAAFS